MKCIQLEYGSELYKKSINLRYKVLREPLNLTFDNDFLSLDKDDYHLAAINDNNEIIGILLLKPIDSETLKMRQVAVDFNFQNQGIGSKLVNFAENFAKEKGFKKIIMHARLSSIYFYLKHGYQAYGDVFIEVTIPHIFMYKNL